MPYIPQSERKRAMVEPKTVGELNYAVTMMCQGFMDRNGGMSYTNINNATGALECAKLELYRRLAAPYEDKKAAENGEVYFPDFLKVPEPFGSLGDEVHKLGKKALAADIGRGRNIQDEVDDVTQSGKRDTIPPTWEIRAVTHLTKVSPAKTCEGYYIDGKFTAKTVGAFRISEFKINDDSWVHVLSGYYAKDRVVFTQEYGKVCMELKNWYRPEGRPVVVRFKLEAMPNEMHTRLSAYPVYMARIVEHETENVTPPAYHYVIPKATFRLNTTGAYGLRRLWINGEEVKFPTKNIRVANRYGHIDIVLEDFCLAGFGGKLSKIEGEFASITMLSNSQAPQSSQPQRDVKGLVDSLDRGRTIDEALRDALVPSKSDTLTYHRRGTIDGIHVPSATEDYSHAEFPMAPQNNMKVPH